MLSEKYFQMGQISLKYLLQKCFLKSKINIWKYSVRTSGPLSNSGYCTINQAFNNRGSPNRMYPHSVKRARYDCWFDHRRLYNSGDFINHNINDQDYTPKSSWDIDHNDIPSSSVRVNCGELRIGDVGKTVEIAGKVSQLKMGRFIHLKDAHGITQVVIPEYRSNLAKRFMSMPLYSYISVVGQVAHRPSNSRNEKMQTGDIEVVMDKFEMIMVNRGLTSNLKKMELIGTRSYSTSSEHSLALTAEEYKLCNGFKHYEEHLKQRKKTCASLDSECKEQEVEIMGWMHRLKLPKFLHLKDGYGVVQCILSDDPALQKVVNDIKTESLIKVTGVVSTRPDSCVNMNVQSGNVEIIVKSITVVNPNEQPTDAVTYVDVAPVSFYAEDGGVNSNCWRTHTCGELRAHNAGEFVKLFGWLEHQRMNKFFTLRDAYGSTQCIVSDNGILDKQVNIQSLSLESVLEVQGSVALRPEGNHNLAMATGAIEVVADSIKVHNPATFHPFAIRSFQKAKEPLRMQYRYLDLRFPEMQRNIRTRSDIVMKMRKFLCDEHNFVEVETPTLFCRTPGGAQEFVVPTRHKGLFYSLVQSPQQFKQILMAGSIDRYFQIARCYRDEDIRGDRQPEFTQLDIEMSFAGRNEILNLVEGLLRKCWPTELPSAIPRLTYKEVMEKYGTDKPDLNNKCEMTNITQIMKQNDKKIGSSDDFIALAIIIKRQRISKKFRRQLVDTLHNHNSIKGFVRKAPSHFNSKEELIDIMPVEKDLGKKIVEYLGVHPDDWLLVGYGPWEETCLSMGELRNQLGEHHETSDAFVTTKPSPKPLWVVDFPLFVKDSESEQLQSCHHPFTAPHPEDIHLLKTEPLKVRSLAYDLVLDGNEIGGGSVRAHDVELQKELLQILNIPEKPLNHMLQALASGCPPHAGIALGMDRFVTLACGASSIRDVIAFPKSIEGRDLLSGAPTDISQRDMDIYHINIKE